jgi:streptogramin lyase
VILLLTAFAAGAAPIPNATFTVYPNGNPPTHTVTAIAADPSGTRLWFTDQNLVQIGFIELESGNVTRWSLRPPSGDTILPVATGQALVFGADGSLWFPAFLATTVESRIGRFSPSTGTVTYFPLPQGVSFITSSQIALGPDGNVWFTDSPGSRLGKITPAGVVTMIGIASASGSTANTMKGLAFGSDGRAWVTTGSRFLFSVPLTGGVATQYRIDGGSFRTPSAITRGPDGHLYFTMDGTSADLGNRIGRITSSGVITEWEIPTPNSQPVGIVAGADGKLYFTEATAKQLGQLDPATGVIRESPIPDGDTPIGIVAIPGGTSALDSIVDESIVELAIEGRPAANFNDGRALRIQIEGDPEVPEPVPDPEAFGNHGGSPARAGSEVTATFIARNNGGATATGIFELTVTLPQSVTVKKVVFQQNKGTCPANPQTTFTCTSDGTPLLPSQALMVEVVFTVGRLPFEAPLVELTLLFEISGGTDANRTNNFWAERVLFERDRGAAIQKIPSLPPALKKGRP